MNLTFEKCLYSSLLLHIFFAVAVSVFSGSSDLKKPFVVFGTYSIKEYHTLYKNRYAKNKSTMVPFVKGAGGNNGFLQKRNKHGKQNSPSKRSNKIAAGSGRGLHVKKTSKSQKCAGVSHSKGLGFVKASAVPKNIKKTGSGSKRILKSRRAASVGQKIHLPNTSLQKQNMAVNEKNVEVKKNTLKTVSHTEPLKTIEKNVSEPEKVEDKTEIKELPPDAKVLPDDDIKDDVRSEALVKSDLTTDNQIISADDVDVSSDDNFDSSETSSVLVLNFSDGGEVGMSYYQKCIQQEVERLWKPPVGVPKGTVCRINFVTDKKGEVKDFEIMKRSRVLIYDLSIIRVAHLFKFDKKLWGKSFTVDFCQ